MGNPAAPTGVDVDLGAWERLPVRALLFGEAQGRVIVSTPAASDVLATAARHGVPARVIGRVADAGEGFRVRVGDARFSVPVGTLADAYHSAIPSIMARSSAAAATADESFQDN